MAPRAAPALNASSATALEQRRFRFFRSSKARPPELKVPKRRRRHQVK